MYTCMDSFWGFLGTDQFRNSNLTDPIASFCCRISRSVMWRTWVPCAKMPLQPYFYAIWHIFTPLSRLFYSLTSNSWMSSPMSGGGGGGGGPSTNCPSPMQQGPSGQGGGLGNISSDQGAGGPNPSGPTSSSTGPNQSNQQTPVSSQSKISEKQMGPQVEWLFFGIFLLVLEFLVIHCCSCMGPYIKYDRRLWGRGGWWITVSISNSDVILFSNNDIILQSEGGRG